MGWPRLWSRRWQGVWLGLLCAALAWYVSRLPMFAGLEDWMLDACFVARGTRASATLSRVVIVEIDEEYLRVLPKPSSHLSPEIARVVSHLADHKVAAIGIDVIIPEEMGRLPGIAGPRDPGEADSMALAMLKAGNVVVPIWKLPDHMQKPLALWRVLDRTFIPKEDDGLSPFLGAVNLDSDRDQFTRTQQLLGKAKETPEDEEEAVWPHLPLAVLAIAEGKSLRPDSGKALLGGEVVPTDGRDRLRINYVGPPGTFRRLRFADLLADQAAGRRRADLEGAIVFLGITARSFQDDHATPYSNGYTRWLSGEGEAGRMAGTEIQANVLATIADRAYIHELPWLTGPLLLVAGAVLGSLLARVGLLWLLPLTLLYLAGWRILCVVAFAQFSFRVPAVGMLLLGCFLFIGVLGMRWRQLRRALALLKSEDIAAAAEGAEGDLGRQASARRVTVLFADIRGFTAFSDGRAPEQVVRLLNAYFDVIVPVIEKHGGTLNQYMGDGIMVIFGAPRDDADHARHAVEAARDMVREVRRHRARWTQEGFPHLRIGVGINTGPAVVGWVGSSNRMDYTAIGETTNEAARIEGMNKELGTDILISEAAYREVGGVAAALGCEATPRKGKMKETELQVHAVNVG